MSSLAIDASPRAVNISFTKSDLELSLDDGRKLTVPLAWFPRLQNATSAQLANYELLGAGVGIHWPELDEDVSVAGLLAGMPSIEKV